MSTFKRVKKEYEVKVGDTTLTHVVEYEVPQSSDLAEAIQTFGGEAALLDRVNALQERSALQSGNLKFKDAPVGGWNEQNLAEVTAKAINAVRGYTPDSGGPGVKAKAEAYDSFVANAKADLDRFKSMSAEEILAALEALTRK